jgi:anti-sigma B factor antagonist
MLTSMSDPKAEQVIIVAEGQGGRHGAASLELSHRILPTGEAIAAIGGELDIATADRAVSYLTQVIDRHHGPIIVDLTALRFCDARGLSVLLQIARYAEQSNHGFRLASPSPSLVKLLRITALDRRLLGAAEPGVHQEYGCRPDPPPLRPIQGSLNVHPTSAAQAGLAKRRRKLSGAVPQP